MRRFLANVNPLVRGLAVVALIALVVIVLNLIARIAFPLAIAFFLFMLWRLRGVKALWTALRQEHESKLTRSRPSWRILVAARHLDGWADALTRVHGEPLMRCEYTNGYGEKCTNPAKEVVVLFHDSWASVGPDRDGDDYIWIACVCGVHKREGMTRRQVFTTSTKPHYEPKWWMQRRQSPASSLRSNAQRSRDAGSNLLRARTLPRDAPASVLA